MGFNSLFKRFVMKNITFSCNDFKQTFHSIISYQAVYELGET